MLLSPFVTAQMRALYDSLMPAPHPTTWRYQYPRTVSNARYARHGSCSLALLEVVGDLGLHSV